jgi:DNA-binding NtrC family response regulator
MERIKQFNLFKNLTDKEIDEITRDLTFNQYEKGEAIISVAGLGKNIYLLIQGKASLIAGGKSGREIILEEIFPGEIFGERTYLGKNTTNTYNMAVAEEETHVVIIPTASLKSYMERYPQFSYNLAQVLAKKVVKLDQKLIEAEEDRKDLYEIVRQKDTEVDLPYQSHVHTRFFEKHSQKIKDLTESGASFIILGEAGTGKYQLARTIFRLSPSFNRIFLAVNFNNPETFQPQVTDKVLTADQVLFGIHTDTTYYSGLVNLARKGTLFLSGFERLDNDVQKKLFSLISRQQDQRLGEDGNSETSLRIIVSSRSTLKALEEQSQIITSLRDYFSEHLISIPPLRDRKKDLPILVDYYVKKFSNELNKDISPLSNMSLKVLVDHVWPGNERELAGTIKRGIVLAEKSILRPEDIHLDFKRIEDKGKIDLLKISFVYNALKNPLSPVAIQWLAAPFFFILTVFLLLGPQDPKTNIGAIYSWALGWPMMVIGSFIWARFWCTICPMGTIGALAKKIKTFDLHLPHIFREYSNWFIMLMAISIMWLEMVAELRYYPFRVGVLLVCIISGAVIFSILFERQTWCSYICGLGGMMRLFAKVSPIELRADKNVCLAECTGQECYTGTDKNSGCPLFQLIPALESNQHCRLCTQCLKNCQYRAINLFLRLPGKELWELKEGSLVISFFIMAMLGALFCELFIDTNVIDYFKESLQFSRGISITIVFTAAVILANLALMFSAVISHFASSDSTKENYSLLGQSYLPLVLSGFISYHVYYLFTLGGKLPAAIADYFHIGLIAQFSFKIPDATIFSFQQIIILLDFVWTAFILFNLARSRTKKTKKIMGTMLSHLVLNGFLAIALVKAQEIHFY